MLVGELLEEVAPTLEDAQTAADPGLKPEGIVGRRAVPAVFCGLEKLEKRLGEFLAND